MTHVCNHSDNSRKLYGLARHGARFEPKPAVPNGEAPEAFSAVTTRPLSITGKCAVLMVHHVRSNIARLDAEDTPFEAEAVRAGRFSVCFGASSGGSATAFEGCAASSLSTTLWQTLRTAWDAPE